MTDLVDDKFVYEHGLMIRLDQELNYMNARDRMGDIRAHEMIVSVPRDKYIKLCEYALSYLKERVNPKNSGIE